MVTFIISRLECYSAAICCTPCTEKTSFSHIFLFSISTCIFSIYSSSPLSWWSKFKHKLRDFCENFLRIQMWMLMRSRYIAVMMMIAYDLSKNSLQSSSSSYVGIRLGSESIKIIYWEIIAHLKVLRSIENDWIVEGTFSAFLIHHEWCLLIVASS